MTIYELGILQSPLTDRSAARLLRWPLARVERVRHTPPDHAHMTIAGLPALMEAVAAPDPWRP